MKIEYFTQFPNLFLLVQDLLTKKVWYDISWLWARKSLSLASSSKSKASHSKLKSVSKLHYKVFRWVNNSRIQRTIPLFEPRLRRIQLQVEFAVAILVFSQHSAHWCKFTILVQNFKIKLEFWIFAHYEL